MQGRLFCEHRNANDRHPGHNAKMAELEKRCELEFNITRGCYCPDCNASVGGAPRSAHLIGKADDIACTNSHERFLIVKNALELGFKRVEVRGTWVHLDSGAEGEGYAQEVMF